LRSYCCLAVAADVETKEVVVLAGFADWAAVGVATEAAKVSLLGGAIAAAVVAVAISVATVTDFVAPEGLVAAAVLSVIGFVATATTAVGTVAIVPAAGAFVRDLIAVQFVAETASLVVQMSTAMNFYC